MNIEPTITAIRRGTRATPVTLRELARSCGISERTAKADIQRLRRAGQPIVSLRGNPHGYYCDLTRRSDYEQRLFKEAVSRLRTLRLMTHSRGTRELMGQLRLAMSGGEK